MDLIKISDMTKLFNVSSKTLRYYEQVGILQATRIDDNKFRYYDSDALERMKQILILRKMQIPVKDIVRIFESEDMAVLTEVFVKKINSINYDINVLTELKEIINEFLVGMQNRGIRKISGIPLLYDIVEKQLPPATLVNVSNKVSSLNEIRLIELSPMRVLSAATKASTGQVSDVEAFEQWTKANLTAYAYGNYEAFDFISDLYGGFCRIRKVPDDFVNDSPFVDLMFGGHFAITGVYDSDNVDFGELYDTMLKHIDDEWDDYVVDRLPSGRVKLESFGFGHGAPSPYVNNGRYEVLIPVRKKYGDIVVKECSLTDLRDSIVPLSRTEINLNYDMVPMGSPTYSSLTEGLTINCDNSPDPGSMMVTRKRFKAPLKIDICIRTDDTNIRLVYHKGQVIFNWEVNNEELRIHDIASGHSYGIPGMGWVPKNEFASISWVLHREYQAIIVNGELRYCAANYPYMQMEMVEDCVGLSTCFGSTLTVKEVVISELS